MIQGFNCAGLVSLIDGPSPDLVGLVHSVQCGVLRFMGGTISQQGRVSTPDLAKAVAFAKEANLPVLWVANFFVGANDCVTALKAFRNAGVEVIGVEIGNETYANDQYQDLPGKYLRRAELFKDAIHDYCGRNELPLIPVSVVMAPDGAMKGFGPEVTWRLMLWNVAILKATWPDAYSLHCYTTGVNATYYSQQQLPDFLWKIAGNTTKPIWVTEHGLDDNHGTQAQRDHYANMVNTLKAFPQVTIATAHNLASKEGDGFNFIEARAKGKFILTQLGISATA